MSFRLTMLTMFYTPLSYWRTSQELEIEILTMVARPILPKLLMCRSSACLLWPQYFRNVFLLSFKREMKKIPTSLNGGLPTCKRVHPKELVMHFQTAFYTPGLNEERRFNWSVSVPLAQISKSFWQLSAGENWITKERPDRFYWNSVARRH